jgi:hypothetical protein
MNLGELRDEVKLIVQDSSFSDSQVDGYINLALQDVCAQCMMPSLKRIATVDTSTTLAYASVSSLTGGFSGRLVKVLNENGDQVEIVPSLELLMEEYGTMAEAGDIEKCCLEGTVLWYAKIPEEVETLTVLYFRDPEELVADADEPVDIPVFCRRPLLVCGAAAMMYDLIEGGEVDEGGRFNFKVYAGMQDDGLRKMQEWLGRNRKHVISSVWSV